MLKLMMCRFQLILSICFVLGSWSSHAQDSPLQPSFYFETFELPGGELGNHVQAIAQDSFGFMWFGSQFGLHRWDGYQVKTYLHDVEDSTSIASNYVECVFVASDGTLWLGHWGQGLDRFDYDTETFKHFSLKSDDPDGVESNYVTEMLEDNEGNIWIGTHQGVFRLDVKTENFTQFLHDPKNPNSLSYDKCRSLFMDSEGILWFGTGYSWEHIEEGGLNRYRPETEDFVNYVHDDDDPNSLGNNKISEIFEDSGGNFWVGTVGDGLHLMDRESGKFQRLPQTRPSFNQLGSPFLDESYDRHIRFVFEDQNQKIWIGAWEGGIKYYDRESGYTQDYYHDENDPQSLPEKFPWKMYQSHDGTLWGCTAGPRGSLFRIKETHFTIHPAAEMGNTMNSFYESKEDKLWIGTERSGLLQFDLKTREQTIFDPSRLQPVTSNLPMNELDQNEIEKYNLLNQISKVVEDKDGWLWIKKWSVGLIRMHPKTGEVKIYQHDLNDDKSRGEGGITDILRDEKDRIWILTTMGDLNLYDPKEDSFIRYKYANPGRGFYYHSVMSSAKDGKLWIAGSGLSFGQLPLVLTKFDPEAETFESMNADIADDPGVKYERIYQVEEDQEGNVWIASETRVKKIIPGTLKSMYLGAFHFGAIFFTGMTIDAQQRIWLFGDKVSLLDPNTGIKSSFDATYPLKSLTDYAHPVYKDSNGIIFFGGKGGFQSFDPKKIEGSRSPIPPETLVFDFHFLNQSEKTKTEESRLPNILTSSEIDLRYDQNAFSFRFTALDFHHPQSNRHEFMLDGYDEQWRTAGIEPKATYVKVAPGDYTLRVRSASQISDWGPEKTVRIHIAPPWWATWWAYTIYILLGLGIIYSIYYFQLKSKLENAEARRLKELDTLKTQLYTNITHEFRTPITVILGMARQIIENPTSHILERMNMIVRNGENLLSLVNQMLDLSKLESGKIVLHLQQSDIIFYLNYLTESFHSFAESRNVQVHFHAEEEFLTMDFDQEKIQQVMTNLLSNAVKFTPSGGHVYVNVSGKRMHDEGVNDHRLTQLQIKVRDTGPGISEEQIPHIFDRFYQGDDTTTRREEGTGIGLALVKELMKLMEGDISVKSKLGKGTEFILSLPIRNEAKERPISLGEGISQGISMESGVGGMLSTSSSKELTNGRLNGMKPQILIIEDNHDVVAYIASCLQENYQISVGNDGLEGIEIAVESIPDLIITDVMMPFKDGFEVCNELKNDDRTSHIPIIMLTARADIDSKLAGLEKGADAYLVKPFHKEELLLRIRNLLENRKKLQAHYQAIAGLKEKQVSTKDVNKKEEGEDQFIIKAKGIVESHLDDANFGVMELAKDVNLSHSQLHRKLSALTGLSTSKFIRTIRLNKAKKMLENPELSISAVAFDTGFNDPGYFGRVFKKEFGITPMEWREK